LYAANAERNPFGGLSLPSIDWSSLKPGKTGDSKGELVDPSNKKAVTRYRLFVPEKLPKNNHLSLLICFHGKGGSENGPADFIYKTIKNLGLDQQYIVLGLKAINEGWEDHDEINVLKAYEWATSVYPIDPRRVYLLGHSSGAHWDTKFGLRMMLMKQ
jgi:poly(3-hydroxybutyrate) depolymerase